MSQSFAEAFVALDEAVVLTLVRSGLDSGAKPLEIVEQCRLGITRVGDLFESGEYYLSELIMAAELFEACMAIVEPHLIANEQDDTAVVVIIGTVSGDIHDLGKNIVAVLLRCAGYNVIDLGVDVPPQRFVDAARTTGAKVLGMSCLMTTGFDSMKETVEAMARAGLRADTYLMIGGGPVTERVREYVGADLCAGDAVAGIRACGQYLAQNDQ